MNGDRRQGSSLGAGYEKMSDAIDDPISLVNAEALAGGKAKALGNWVHGPFSLMVL